MREYAPGDRIKFTIDFTHKDNIPKWNIWAVFSYAGSEQTNLSEFIVQGRIVVQEMLEDHKSSFARFESNPVGMNIVPGGEYVLTRVIVRTYGGVEMDAVGPLPNVRLRLLHGEPRGAVKLAVL